MALKLILINFFLTVSARVLIIPDQIIENCHPESAGKYFDLSELQLIPINDTHTFLDGKWKFKKAIPKKWKGSLTTEKYTRGEWLVQAFNRNYDDICPTLHSPLEPTYNVFKGVPGCPVKAGTAWDFDMVPVTFSETLLNTIPPHYMGRWRTVFVSEFTDENGKVYKECTRAYADIYED